MLIMTKILDLSKKSIREAALVLSKGGLVIYPTESAYALGCDATNGEAAKKIFSLKKRGGKYLPMVVGSLGMAKKYGYINRYAATLLKKFVSRPLTLIVPKKNIPDVVNTEFVFRIGVGVAGELSRALGKPVVSTSANISGAGVIYSFAKVRDLFDGKVDVILDGGDLVKRPVSTIVKDGKVIREGAISAKEIGAALSG
jgi:L-threonylcarbamoyladenylate synthase